MKHKELWTRCPTCKVTVRVKHDTKTIWKHSPGRESVARKLGPRDPTPPEICNGSGVIPTRYLKTLNSSQG